MLSIETKDAPALLREKVMEGEEEATARAQLRCCKIVEVPAETEALLEKRTHAR